MTIMAHEVIKNVGPKMVPFFKSLAVYFVVFMPHDKPSIVAAILKCLPILSLMIFVAWYSKDLETSKQQFSKKIFLGLLFSCLGDICLVWPQFFDLGMLAFAVGHINYIRAFGFEPQRLTTAIAIYAIAILGSIWLLPDLRGVLIPGVPIYAAVISTMMWRAFARLDDKWTWTMACTAIGALSFVLSDLTIAIDQFKFRVPYDQLIIMSTYYAAQFGLALSVVDSDTSQRRLKKN